MRELHLAQIAGEKTESQTKQMTTLQPRSVNRRDMEQRRKNRGERNVS